MMKEKLLERVSSEKLEKLQSALSDVLGELDGAVPFEERYEDNGYVSCFYLRTELMVVLKRKLEVKRLKDNEREA